LDIYRYHQAKTNVIVLTGVSIPIISMHSFD
jgi:hypothetical protein